LLFANFKKAADALFTYALFLLNAVRHLLATRGTVNVP